MYPQGHVIYKEAILLLSFRFHGLPKGPGQASSARLSSPGQQALQHRWGAARFLPVSQRGRGSPQVPSKVTKLPSTPRGVGLSFFHTCGDTLISACHSVSMTFRS